MRQIRNVRDLARFFDEMREKNLAVRESLTDAKKNEECRVAENKFFENEVAPIISHAKQNSRVKNIDYKNGKNPYILKKAA